MRERSARGVFLEAIRLQVAGRREVGRMEIRLCGRSRQDQQRLSGTDAQRPLEYPERVTDAHTRGQQPILAAAPHPQLGDRAG
jgi:hypothetical protein